MVLYNILIIIYNGEEWMFKKRITVLIVSFALFIGIGTAALAVSQNADEHSADEFGNLSTVLLSGGYAADYANGMVVFSDSENSGYLSLRNTASGRERVISSENASYINVIGNKIYYVTSSGENFSIVRTTLSSEREVLVQSDEKISNLFVEKDGMYYLRDDSAVYFSFANSAESVLFSNPQMKAFVPGKDGIYWLKDKPSDEAAHSELGTCSVNGYEGTEDEAVNYDCYLYSPELGKSVETVITNALKVNGSDEGDLSSLALTAKVGEKTLPTAEYPVGSFFTDSGNGCTDHRTGSCGWEYEGYCNCKAFHNGVSLKAVQCFAFARYVYYECFGEIGTTDSKTSTNIGSIPKGSVTEESFKALISQTKPGAHIRVRYLKANGVTVSTHSMIILDWNESGFSVLESNVDGKCGVNVSRISYSSYVPKVVSVEFLMMPDEYPEGSEEESADSTNPEESTTVTAPDSENSTVTESTTAESVTGESQTQTTTDADSGFADLLLMVSEKILEFFAMIIDLIVMIL